MPSKIRSILQSVSDSFSFGSHPPPDMSSPEDLGMALHSAAVRGNKRALNKILKTGIAVDYPNDTGQTALFCACYEAQEHVVSLLLSRGADPNTKSREGSTALHAAAYSSSISIVSRLVAYGGDLRLHDNCGRTVYDWALRQSDTKRREIMLDFLGKIKMFAMTRSGRNLAEEKQSREFHEVVKHDRSNSLTLLFKRVQRLNSSSSTKTLKSVQSLGFGKVYLRGSEEAGCVASIPLIPESMLHHDTTGLTYNNGPFMVNESMRWDRTLVTAKRLHKHPLDGGVVDLLINEHEHMARLRHPHILLLMGVCQTHNMDGLVLLYERVGLGSLYHYLHHACGELGPLQVCVLMRQVSDALLYLHQQNLVHCALSSHAIQLVSLAVAKLGNMEYMIDNSLYTGVCPRSDVVNNRYVNAAYNWMAPEVMAGEVPTELTDLYSLCAVIWESIHCTVPWNGLHPREIMGEVLESSSSLPLDTDHLGRNLYAMLAAGLNSDITVRSTLSIDQIREVLARVYQDCRRPQHTLIKVEKQEPSSTGSVGSKSEPEDPPKDDSHHSSQSSLDPSSASDDRSTLQKTEVRQDPKKSSASETAGNQNGHNKANSTESEDSEGTQTNQSETAEVPNQGEELEKEDEEPQADNPFKVWTIADEEEVQKLVSHTVLNNSTNATLSSSGLVTDARKRLSLSRGTSGSSELIGWEKKQPCYSTVTCNLPIKPTGDSQCDMKRGRSVYEVLSQPAAGFTFRACQGGSERLSAIQKTYLTAVSNHQSTMDKTHPSALSSGHFRKDSSVSVASADPHVPSSPGTFKPASHRKSMDKGDSPTKLSRRESLLVGEVPSQTGSLHQLLPPPRSVQRTLTLQTASAPGPLPNDRATLPRNFRSPAKEPAHQPSMQGWDHYKSERYLQLTSNVPPRDHDKTSPTRISPRNTKDVWFGGSGNIKDLINDFQQKWCVHEEKQAVLCLKSKKTDAPESPALTKIIEARNQRNRPAGDEKTGDTIIEIPSMDELAFGERTPSEGRASLNSNNNATDDSRRGSELDIPSRTPADVEEFYFDDEINPDVTQEKHLRLQTPETRSIEVRTPARRPEPAPLLEETPVHRPHRAHDANHPTKPMSSSSQGGLPSDHPEVIPETPTASNSSELQDGAEIGDGLGPLYSEGHTEQPSGEVRLLPPRRESLHIAHIADRSGDSYQEEEEEEEEEITV